MERPSPRIIGLVAGLGVVGWVVGFGVDRVVGGFLALPDDANLARPEYTPSAPDEGDDGGEALADAGPVIGSGPTRRTPSKREYVDPVVARSIFDSTKVGVKSGPGGGDGLESMSDIEATLLATVVTVPNDYSSALIILGKGDGKAQGFGIGASLGGQGTIVDIEQRKVVIERPDGSREFIAMEDKAEPVRPSGPAALGKGEEKDEGVEKAGDNKFIVDADLVESALANPEKLAGQIRVAPHKDASGNVDGYRLSGIRRNSLFRKLGIKNGDIVHAVNGQPLTSMQAAMGAYESMQNDKNFSFDVTRRNKRETFEYEIR
ncbi:MAG: PDZ domain-containing protein [Alphaproteobacteria bacterium]|nr:PDZ domain-containing protein [Alphaproteobacteria bacterium]